MNMKKKFDLQKEYDKSEQDRTKMELKAGG